jgi:D-lactate dehydrogenase (cytochrome)
MPGWSIQSRRPRGQPRGVVIGRDPDVLASFLEDAAHSPGGHASGLVVATSETDIADALRLSPVVLPIGAQSSLTGGATPMGDVLVSTSRLNHIIAVGADSVRVEAGVVLADLLAALEEAGRYYPPTPTFTGAFVGGTVATNAAGAATFKYGTTRDWVLALTVVLPSGDVLDIERGATRAHPDGYFDIVLPDRVARLPVPRYRMPRLAKLAAGYFADPEMDLIDLFIGSEGTLGVIIEVTLRVLPRRPAMCLALVPFADREAAFAFVRQLRDTTRNTWRTADARGIDVSAIEHMDARCLALLREEGVDRANGFVAAQATTIALLVTIELPPGTRADQAYDDIGRAREKDAPDTPLGRFCRSLDAAGVLDDVEIAVPGERARAEQLLAIREGVPDAVNQRIVRAKRSIDGRIEKTAADMIVPFDRLDEFVAFCEAGFRRRGLDSAVWGHISDGNLHPNVIPRSMVDVESGKAAILELGREAIRLGGSPLAEHGVGRNAVKQRLLEELYGRAGVDDMRRVKRAIDPDWKLAPGVLFANEQFTI